MVQARALLTAQTVTDDAPDTELSGLLGGDALRQTLRFEIPPGVPFDQPEQASFTWEMALNADELIGLLGTMSWIITMPDDRRQRVVDEARRLLRELLGIEGDTTVDVAFRADAWRSHRN